MKTTEQAPQRIADCEMAFAIPGSDSIIDVIRPDTGTSWHYRETLEQVRLRYPGAQIVNCEEHYKAKAARQDTPIVWMQTTREKYWEMLEVLPPAAMGNGGFLVGEPWDHHATTGQPRFAGFREWRGKFYEANRPLTRKEYAVEMVGKPGMIEVLQTETPAHNNNCDGSRCLSESGPVRVLPTGGDSNAILCRACFNHELSFRRERNRDLSKDCQFKLPEWESLKPYTEGGNP